MGWKSKCDRAKKLHRPSLKNWECDGLYSTFPSYASTYLPPQVQTAGDDNTDESFLPFGQANRYHRRQSLHHENAPLPSDETSSRSPTPILRLPIRFDAKSVSPYEFKRRYESKYLPCVITNIPQGHDVTPPPPPRGHLRFLDDDEEEKKSEEVGDRTGGDAGKTGGSYYKVGRRGDTTVHAWEALKRWSFEALMDDERMRERTFKCGEDDDGNTIRV